MATATTVAINVVVNGTQAVAGIDQVNAHLATLGPAAAAGTGEANAGLSLMQGHLATNREGVRLLSEEFGLRMPRALTNVISKIRGVGTAVQGMIAGFVGFAMLEVAVRAAEALWKAFDMDGQKARELQKSIDDTGMTMRRMTDDITAQTLKLQDEQAKIEKKPFQNGIALALADAMTEADQLAEKLDLIESRFSKDVIQPQGSDLSSRIMGGGNTKYEASMMAEHQKWMSQAVNTQDQLKEEISYGESLQTRLSELQKKHAASVGSDNPLTYGNELKAVQEMIAQQKGELAIVQGTVDRNNAQAAKDAAQVLADANKPKGGVGHKSKDDAATQQAEAAKLLAQDERAAANASLEGWALENAKRLEEIADQTARLTELHHAERIPAATKLINDKFYADGQKSLAESAKEAQEIWDESTKEYNSSLAEQARAKEAAAAKATAMDERISEQEAAFAARASDAQRHARAGGLTGWISDHQAAVAAIEAQDTEETLKLNKLYDESLKTDRKMTDAEYQQAKVNLDSAADAQIAAQNQEMAHQIADTLQSAFANPVDFIKKKMQQMMFEIMAQWIESLSIFQKIFGSTMGGLQPGGSPGAAGGAHGGASGGLMGKLTGFLSPHSKAAAPSAATHAQASGGSSAGASTGGATEAQTAEISGVGGSYSGGSGGSHFGGGGRFYSGADGGGDGGSYSGGGESDSVGTASIAAATRGAGAAGTASSVGAMLSGGTGVASTVKGAYGSIQARKASASTIPGGATTAQSSDGGVPSFSSRSAIPGSGGAATAAQAADGSGPSFSSRSAIPGSGGAAGPSDGALAGQGDSLANSMSKASQNPDGSASGASTAIGDTAAVGMGSYEGYEDTKSDFKSGSASGTMKGMLGDAAAGAMIGSVFGPLGTVIGAAAGAFVGLVAGVTGAIMGEGGRLAARDYYKKTLFPEIEKQRNGAGATDFQQAISEVNKTASDGVDHMRSKWGHAAAQWVDDNYLRKEQQLADSQLEARAKGGSYAVGMSAKQFHTGGDITGFGDFGTSSDEGFIHVRLGEKVMNQSASDTHGSVLHAMNAGASATDVARMYLAGSGGGGSQAVTASGGTTHQWNVQALDAKSFDKFLAGGGDSVVVKHVNKFASKYAGDGICG